MMKLRKKTLFRLIPVVLMLLAPPIFVGCDPGGDAGQPTGPDSEYDPSFPEGSNLGLRLSPSSVFVDQTTETVDVKVKLNSATTMYPIEGVPVTFGAEGGVIVSPRTQHTDVNGNASTTAYVHPGTAPGSYTISAWTSFGDFGPLTQDYKILKVTSTPVQAVQINPAQLASGTVGTAYSDAVSASGGTGSGTYTWAFSGSLPAGLSFTSTPTVALISGTPTTAGSTQFVVTVTDLNDSSDSALFSITIAP